RRRVRPHLRGGRRGRHAARDRALGRALLPVHRCERHRLAARTVGLIRPGDAHGPALPSWEGGAVRHAGGMTDVQEPRRARELGIVVGPLPTGPHNALTDVPGVRVGHTTVADPPRLHTGVTAIVPDALGPGRRSLPCGLFVGNGFGKLVGATQVAELGAIETPVLLTATLSAFRAADALVTHVLAGPGHEATRTLNPVVGETNDGLLSDVRARPVTEAHVFAALDGATGGPVAEGCVGAGTGTTALGFKGGIGTASRLVDGWTVGALVQSNFSGTLTVRGVPIPADAAAPAPEGNSCMIVVATDAPLDARQLGRVARRAVFAMAR